MDPFLLDSHAPSRLSEDAFAVVDEKTWGLIPRPRIADLRFTHASVGLAVTLTWTIRWR